MRIFTVLAMSAIFSAGFSPAFAEDTQWAIPKQCELPETKVAHPNWYRDGGYCTADSFYSEKPAPRPVAESIN